MLKCPKTPDWVSEISEICRYEEGHCYANFMDRKELIESNRDWWNERAPLHVASEFYHVGDLVNGASLLDEFEENELVSRGGESLLHLQCHIGTDTISWARRGFDVTGLDFSEAAIGEAERHRGLRNSRSADPQ